MSSIVKIAVMATLLTGFTAPLTASAADLSPTILIETGPSDNPAYRRMVFVKYLSGNTVTANYKAYNRRQFINLPDKGMSERVTSCARGPGTSLSEIKSYERAEAKRNRKGQAPEARTFCIKNISNWKAKNKDRYLDPIFASMPYLAQ